MHTVIVSTYPFYHLLFSEMGHLWGAVHDDEPECRPDSVNGRFIMHSSSNTGYDSNHFKFSPCSIRSIHRVLYAVSDNCFVGEQSALCGNGILEEGEQCDPGGQLALGFYFICLIHQTLCFRTS